jgi:hypothetical protein
MISPARHAITLPHRPLLPTIPNIDDAYLPLNEDIDGKQT